MQIDNTRFDRHKSGEHFYGAYGSIEDLLPGMTVEPYLLFKQNLLIKSETVFRRRMVTSPGVRIMARPPAGSTTSSSAVLQRGSYSADRVSARRPALLRLDVSDASLETARQRGVQLCLGGPTRKDGVRNTFDQFYPSNHSYYGMIDQFGWKNMKNFRAGFDLVPVKKIKFRTDFNEFYLATVQDSLYNSSGTSAVLNRKATSAHIGSELNTVALYQWTKIWKFGAGFGRLYAGDFLKQSKFACGYTYPYLMFYGAF